MSERRTVLIPIVPVEQNVSTACGNFVEVYASPSTAVGGRAPIAYEERRLEDKALEKYWDWIATPLRPAGPAIYRAGCAAASAVRKLGLRRPRAALYQLLKPRAWIEHQRLHSANPDGPTEGRSAELGLALALLMSASGSRARWVVATGALSGAPSPARTDDVEVLPVGSIREKLGLLLDCAKRDDLPGRERASRLLCFTPQYFEEAGRRLEVRRLAEVEALERLGIKVIAVGWLSEAATALGARSARYLPSDRICQGLIGALAALVILTLGWWQWNRASIDVTFLAADTGAAEPFHVCFSGNGGYRANPLIRRGLVPVIGTGETLGWRVQVGRAPGFDTRLADLVGLEYHLAHLMIAERSKLKIEVLDESTRPGDIVEWGWALNNQAEVNGLVLLARRNTPFDAEALRAQVLERFPQAAGADAGSVDISAVVDFLTAQAPGSASFVFATRPDEAICEI